MFLFNWNPFACHTWHVFSIIGFTSLNYHDKKFFNVLHYVPIYSRYEHSSCLSGKVFNYTLMNKKIKKHYMTLMPFSQASAHASHASQAIE